MSAEAPAPLNRTHWAVQLLAAAGLLAIVGFIAIVIFFVAMSGQREYQPAKVEGNDREISFTVGNPIDLPGTGLMRMDVAASQADGSYSSRSGQDTRNILLIDKASGDSRKLLPDNRRRIVRQHFLPTQDNVVGDGDLLVQTVDGKKKAPPPVAYYLLEVDRPGQPGQEDVLVGRLSDRQQAYVMTKVDGIDGLWMRSPTQIGLVVRDRLKLYYRVIDIPTLKVVQSRPITID